MLRFPDLVSAAGEERPTGNNVLWEGGGAMHVDRDEIARLTIDYGGEWGINHSRLPLQLAAARLQEMNQFFVAFESDSFGHF